MLPVFSILKSNWSATMARLAETKGKEGIKPFIRAEFGIR